MTPCTETQSYATNVALSVSAELKPAFEGYLPVDNDMSEGAQPLGAEIHAQGAPASETVWRSRAVDERVPLWWRHDGKSLGMKRRPAPPISPVAVDKQISTNNWEGFAGERSPHSSTVAFRLARLVLLEPNSMSMRCWILIGLISCRANLHGAYRLENSKLSVWIAQR